MEYKRKADSIDEIYNTIDDKKDRETLIELVLLNFQNDFSEDKFIPEKQALRWFNTTAYKRKETHYQILQKDYEEIISMLAGLVHGAFL